MTEAKPSCSYVRGDGTTCPGTVEEEGGQLCFWHHPKVSKEGPDVKQRLEEWADSGESMEGFVLRYAQLQGVKLIDPPRGYNLSRANLFRAQFQGARMFNIDLRGSDLLKSDLSGANLNEAKMQGTDLLGATLDGTRMVRVQWGDQTVQEQQAYAAEAEGRQEDALARFEEAEEVYRSLRRAYDNVGHFDEAGMFFSREMTMRRMLLPKWSTGRAWSKTVDLFCAYGESPPRVIGSAVLLNLVCATAYFAVGVKGPDGRLGFSAEAGFGANLHDFLNCVYFSVVTFTTLGFGDMTPPDGFIRGLAAMQAFTGAFMMAMFVAVFGKKMTRG